MGWKGVIIGSCLGSVVGHGLWGALFGAWAGNAVENRFFPKSGRRSRGPYENAQADHQRAMVFCASAAAMLAKMAKADGRVTAVEIKAVERAFQRLGFSPAARKYAIEVFRRAKDDSHNIYEYARDFAAVIDNEEMLLLFYGILWELAAADGAISAEELFILRQITGPLEINPQYFDLYAAEWRQRGMGMGADGEYRRTPPPPRDELADAYTILGVSASDSDETVRRAYREKAKKCHPDSLRAQGLPDELIGKANERMARINEAWAKIKSARGL